MLQSGNEIENNDCFCQVNNYQYIIYSFINICMNNFNTYDYEFLIKCLLEGSLAFKAEALKRLTTLAQNDKKQFMLNSKNILASVQQLYNQEKQDINILTTFLLSEIILNSTSKDNEQAIKSKHLKHLIENLGHVSKSALRKASHTCLLAYIKSYHNFDGLIEEYLDYGFDNPNILIKQKSINSFQSIFILEVKYMRWESAQTKRLFQTVIQKAGDQNLQIAKAAAQCLLSLLKNQLVRKTVASLSIGYLNKFYDFLTTTYNKLPTLQLSISLHDVKQMMENLRNKPKIEQKSPVMNPQMKESRKQSRTIEISNTSTSITYQRRLQKIKKAINHQNEKKNNEKDAGFAKMFGNINSEGSLKERTQAVENLLFKIQTSKNKPEFQGSVRSILPQIIKMLRDPNPKIVSLTLRIIQNIVHELKEGDPQLQNLINVIIEKLSDQKISIRQIVSKVIKQLIGKTTDKGIWVKELLENLLKSNNTFSKDETLNLIYSIYEENQIEDISYPVNDILMKIAPLTEDPKTKIKIRTIDCLSQIVFKSNQVNKFNDYLKKQISDVFFQMYSEKLNKLILEKQRKLAIQSERKKKGEDNSNYRTAYHERSAHYTREKDINDDQLNVSMDVVKKRVSQIKKRRGLFSTQQTSSLDRNTRHGDRTIDNTSSTNHNANIEEVDIMLPSLYKKSRTNRFMLTKRIQANNTLSPSKGPPKNEIYLSRNQLKPLSDPQLQLKNILNDLKTNDWKVQFDTTNKLRRLVEFNPELILSASATNLHVIILDVLNLIESLRSSVSKNGLICLNQLVMALGKQIDPQMQIILEKLIKKSADTNVFISSQVQKCLKSISTNATPSKVIQKLGVFRQSKNFAIKDAYISTLLGMQSEEKIRSKQYGRLVEAMVPFLNQGQLDLRSKAKNGIIEVCNSLGDWYRALRGKVNSSSFKIVCDLMTKNSAPMSTMSADTSPSNPRKTKLAKTELKTINVESVQERRKEVSSNKKSFIKVSQFPPQFNEIQNMIDLSNSSEWKKRIEASQGLKILGLKYPQQFIQYRSSSHFIDVLSKQISEPNVKVSVNAMEIFEEIFQPLRRLVQNNLSVICSSIFGALSSNKVEIKQSAQRCTSHIINEIETNIILQHMCQGILYSLPKSRIYLIIKLQELAPQIHSEKKQLLFKHVFPVLNKLMDEYKAELMPHVVNLFSILYDVMGNNMFSHITKFKQVRELIAK